MEVSVKAPRRVAVLGATGSIGRQALDVIRNSGGRLAAYGLACRSNIEGLAELVAEFSPVVIALGDDSQSENLKRRLEEAVSGPRPKLLVGRNGLLEMASAPGVDVVLNALVGASGLMPTIAALEAGKCVALANKESLVMAGAIVMEKASGEGALVPVDSEHSSLFRCLHGRDCSDVRGIYLTGSGGALRSWPAERMSEASPEDVLRHPVWHMGKRITVDSATMMNKGLEIIEAQHLFQVDPSRIHVVVHPQALVHGLIELEDGTLLAHMSEPDMKVPIAYALYYPSMARRCRGSFDLTTMGNLTFEKPDLERYPCLGLGYRAAQQGGTTPAALNAADEVAVDAFLEGKIYFTDIAKTIRQIMDEHDSRAVRSIEQVLEVDRLARERARSLLAGPGA